MVPIFRSTYSIGKSILTLEDIIDIAKEGDLKEIILVEDNLTSFMKAFHLCEKNNLDLVYGLRITMSNENLDDDSDHKAVIFAMDDKGCKLLNKIYSLAFVDNNGKLRYRDLKSLWDSKSLSFVVPFYDSFIHENNLHLKNCIPEIHDLNPKFWMESNKLPIDFLLQQKVLEYAQDAYAIHDIKTIYYKNKEDVEALQTYKILTNRSFGRQATLSNPNLSHFGSDEFCWESFKKQTA